MKDNWLVSYFEKKGKNGSKKPDLLEKKLETIEKTLDAPKNAMPIFAVRLLLEEDGHVLFLHQTRQNGGRFSLPGGNVDGLESAREALCREANEEAGIKLTPDRLEFCHLLHRRKPKTGEVLVNIYFRARQFKGEPVSREPEKFRDVAWLPLAALPEEISNHTRKVLENIVAGEFYTEWPKLKKKKKDKKARPETEPFS